MGFQSLLGLNGARACTRIVSWAPPYEKRAVAGRRDA